MKDLIEMFSLLGAAIVTFVFLKFSVFLTKEMLNGRTNILKIILYICINALMILGVTFVVLSKEGMTENQMIRISFSLIAILFARETSSNDERKFQDLFGAIYIIAVLVKLYLTL